MKRYKRKKGKIQSKKTTVDGIKFRSKLEAFTYKKLKEAGIKQEYESERYTLLEGFYYTSDAYEQSTTASDMSFAPQSLGIHRLSS